MDGRQAVAELVRDARRQLAEPRQAVLQSQLIFEVHDLAEIGEQADRPVGVPGFVANRRDRHAEVRGASRNSADRAAHHRLGFRQAFVNHRRELGRAAEHLGVCAGPVGLRQAEQLPARRIESADDPAKVDDEQAGGEARDDLVAEPFGGLGSRLHRALLQPQVAQRVLHRRGHEDRLTAAAAASPVDAAGGDDESKDRVRENRGKSRDDGGEPQEEEEARLVHRAGHDTTADG